MTKERDPLRPSQTPRASIPARALADIRALAERFDVEKIVLFGSRARGTNEPGSDIDLAVYGCGNLPAFAAAMEEEVWTLLKFDLVDMTRPNPHLASEIDREGIVIYEKVR